MEAPPSIVHLIGFPAVGKLTIAHALRVAGEAAGQRFVVVDNHRTGDLLLSVIDADGVKPLPPEIWGRVDEVRQVLYRTIEDLSPPSWSFVFTNVITASDPVGPKVVSRLTHLAERRDSTYVPVLLTCERTELLRRVPQPDRATKLKWIDPTGVAAFVDRETMHRPAGDVFDLDVTRLAPDAAASEILGHVARVASDPS